MQKILLDTDNELMNRRQVLKSINGGSMSRTNMTFNFIKAGDKHYCLFTTCDDERASLPPEMKDSLITYQALKAKALC